MKKLIKFIFWTLVGLVLLYSALWFGARIYTLSTLEKGITLKDGSLEASPQNKGRITVSGFPFSFQLKTSSPIAYTYQTKEMTLPITLSDVHVSYHLQNPMMLEASLGSATVLPMASTRIEVSNITASATMASGIKASMEAKAVEFGSLKASCLRAQNVMLTGLSDGSHTHEAQLDATTGLSSGCKTLLPSLYQPILTFLPLKEAAFKTHITGKIEKAGKKKIVILNLQSKTLEGQPLAKVQATLSRHPQMNPKGRYNGHITLTLNQVKKEKKKKKENIFSLLANTLADGVKNKKGNYVLDFDVKNNEVGPSQKTLNRLTAFVFN